MANRPIVARFVALSIARAVRKGGISAADAARVLEIVGEAAFALDPRDEVYPESGLDAARSRALSDFRNELEDELAK